MSLDDERVRFYLRHRARIEQWAALRSEVALAVDEWLLGLQPDVVLLASKIGGGATYHADVTDPDEKWPKLGLRRPSWPSAEGVPSVWVALEWMSGKTTLYNIAPYVGLVGSRETALGAAIRSSEALQEAKRARKSSSNQGWHAVGDCIFPDPEFPASKDQYRDGLLKELREAWKSYAPVVDGAVRNLTSGR
jgi:hypothetical protein